MLIEFSSESLKRPFERPRRGCEDDIKIYLKKKIWSEVVDLIYLAQDMDRRRALVKKIMNLRVPLKVRNFIEQLSDYQLLMTDSDLWSYSA
jgi:hypothetical protein